MTIQCRGREYPNAPIWYLTGSKERLPPHFWFTNLHSLTGPVAHLNDFKTIEALDPKPTGRFKDPTATWSRASENLNTGARFVTIDRDETAATLRLTVAINRLSGGSLITVQKVWATTRPEGFLWHDFFYPMTLEFTHPLWFFGGPADTGIFKGTYGLIPPNVCSGA